MIKGSATLVIDLGNSSTKGLVLFGKNAKTGKYNKRKFDIPNVFSPVSGDYEVPDEYSEETSSVLCIDSAINGVDLSGNYCTGEIQQKEFPSSTIRPSATRKKYECESTPLSLRMAFLYAYRCIMDMNKTRDYGSVDVTWKVITLLPPGDIEQGKAAILSLVDEIKSIDFVFPEVHIDIKIDKSVVLPEGYCAYIATVFNEGQSFREDYEYLSHETVLVFDIGAGTTDIILVKDNKLVQNSKHTIQQGGNNVYQLVRRKLQLKGLDLDEADVRKGVIEGYVKDGSKKIQIIDIVNDAKTTIAQKIVTQIQDFLELTDIKARSVGYLVACGGGAMRDSNCDAIIPLSEKVIEFFKGLSPNAELVQEPIETIKEQDEDGEVHTVERRLNLREMNVIGASILAEVM